MDNKTCGINAVAKQPSILENEINQLRLEVNRINDLSEGISNLIRPQRPCSDECCAAKSPVSTIANSLLDIRYVAEEARGRFEEIGKLLEEQLGDLKLEY